MNFVCGLTPYASPARWVRRNRALNMEDNLAEAIMREWVLLLQRAKNMSCEDQEQLARAIAANIGYELAPENYQSDTSIVGRIQALEKRVFGDHVR
jgi:hypothetical protein